jgi:hypothetical protein
MELDIAKMKRIQKAHYESTKPMDSYFTGMYNGMEVLIASLENREGQFMTVEQLSFDEIKPQDASEVF